MSNHADLSSPIINLEFLRKEAKSLLRRCRSGNHQGLERVRAELPRFAELTDERAAFEIRLADVHHALARERGYVSWAELKRANDSTVQADFSKPGADGALPEGFTPWRWGVTYTVRPEMRSSVTSGHEYKISVSVLRKANRDEEFRGYAGLYERAVVIAATRIADLPQPSPGAFLHTRIVTQGWFRHANTQLVRAFLTIGVVCLKEGESGQDGEREPTASELTMPGGMTPDNYTAPESETKKRLDEGVSEGDVRDNPEEEDIFLVSYGEYVPACSTVDYKPLVERAERLARSYYFFSKTRQRLSGVNGSAPRRRTSPSRISTFGPSEGSARFVCLGEAVTHVRHAERAVALRRDLEVKSLAVVLWRRARLLPLWRRRERRDGHGFQLLIVCIGYEHSRNGVLLAAELREVNLPQVF